MAEDEDNWALKMVTWRCKICNTLHTREETYDTSKCPYMDAVHKLFDVQDKAAELVAKNFKEILETLDALHLAISLERHTHQNFDPENIGAYNAATEILKKYNMLKKGDRP